MLSALGQLMYASSHVWLVGFSAFMILPTDSVRAGVRWSWEQSASVRWRVGLIALLVFASQILSSSLPQSSPLRLPRSPRLRKSFGWTLKCGPTISKRYCSSSRVRNDRMIAAVTSGRGRQGSRQQRTVLRRSSDTLTPCDYSSGSSAALRATRVGAIAMHARAILQCARL
jgi:hypothetical protein